MNPPRLVLEVGGTSTQQAAMPGELKSPPTWKLEVGGTSRWADLAVYKLLSGSADRRPQRHGLLGRSHQEPGRGEENIFIMSIFMMSEYQL